MPGRYAITSTPESLREFFRYVEQPDFPPRYNIAPTQPVPVVRLERAADGATARHFVLMRWGFLPGFVKEPKTFPLLINARSESMAEKPSFRNAVRRRRGLFIADCYYEWDRTRAAKSAGQAYMVRRADGAPFGFAGLWEDWAGADGSEIETACFITVPANAEVAAIHERMPAIIEEKDFEVWLSLDEEETAAALRLVRPAPDGSLTVMKIGKAINKVANDGPEVQAPA
jgi:putative SOS response-associated peptidase YedK